MYKMSKEATNNGGVSFSVWEKRDADGKASGLPDWTCIVGNENIRVLTSIPKKFPQILYQQYCDTIVQIWKVILKGV